MQLIQLLRHCFHLHLGLLHLGRLVGLSHDLWINNLLKPFRHLLRAWPVHVLNEQVTCHLPELRVGLQNHAHCIQCFLTLGHVGRAGSDHHVVLTHAGIVNLVDDNIVFIPNFFDRLCLSRVELDHFGVAVQTNDASHTLGVINLRNQANQLTGNMPDSPRQIIDVMIRARIRLTLARQNRLARTLIRGRSKTGVVLPCGRFDVV